MVSAILLACCVPAAKLVARAVEAQANTFTIGGAAFTGMLLAPWIVWLTDRLAGQALGVHIPILPVLAVLAIAYAFGESIGRLACISFGCCYGKPLSSMPRGLTRLFERRHFAFSGATKKAAYEGGLEMVPVIPIQAVTAVLFVGVALVGLLLFLRGHTLAAFAVTWLSTQAWRVVSEFFRADYRGKDGFSVYQILAVVGAVYGIAAALLVPCEAVGRPDVVAGLRALWNPAAILAIQAVWLVIFLYTGRSSVTTSTVAFSLSHDRR
jgi:prolipoprotein diacylglyceryltransferase